MELEPKDLAPGDRSVAERDWSDLRIHRVGSAADPEFTVAYQRLWGEFGPRGEMETERVIRERIAWEPTRPVGSCALAYELLVLRRSDNLVAVRDHTAVVRLGHDHRPVAGPVVVHLSHALVEPSDRGTGLAGWLRALPLSAARRIARACGLDAEHPVILVAEMEPAGPDDAVRRGRLRSYTRAGFRKIDPEVAPYAQPDFRSADVLASASPRAISLELVVRRVGREGEGEMPAAEVAAVVESIYAVYGAHVPPHAIDPLRAAARTWTASRAAFQLLGPAA